MSSYFISKTIKFALILKMRTKIKNLVVKLFLLIIILALAYAFYLHDKYDLTVARNDAIASFNDKQKNAPKLPRTPTYKLLTLFSQEELNRKMNVRKYIDQSLKESNPLQPRHAQNKTPTC